MTDQATTPPTPESELVARLRTEIEIWKCSYGGAGYPHLMAILSLTNPWPNLGSYLDDFSALAARS